MTIVTEEAPQGLLDVVASGLANLPPATEDAVGAQGSQLYRPLPLYSASTGALAEAPDGRPPPLERVGWRVLIDEGSAMAVAEVRSGNDGPVMVALWRGAVAGLVANASVAAEEKLSGERVHYARVIALPEIGLEVLWLHADFENDVVVPLLEEDTPTSPLRAFTAEARGRALALAPLPKRDGTQRSDHERG